MSVPAICGDISLRQEIVAICDGFPSSQSPFWQWLADHQMEVRIHLVKRFTVPIQSRNYCSTDPFVPGLDFCAEARHLAGNSCANRMQRDAMQDVSQRIVDFISRCEGAAKGIDRC